MNRSRFPLLALGCLLAADGIARAGSAALYSITDISFPNYSFGTGEGFGINDAGAVVGTAQNASGSHAFVYSGGALTDLGTLGGADSQAFAINSSGQVAGDSMLNSGLHHPFSDNGTSMTDLTPSASYAGYANGINISGQEVGTLLSGTSGGANAFLYSGGAVSAIGTLGGAHSSAFGINASGQIAGGADTTHSIYHAFIASGGVLTDLGTLGGTSSIAYAINSAGDTAGAAQISGGTYHAFLYAGGAMHDLGALGGGVSYAYALNSLDMVAGQSLTSNSVMDATIYFNGTLQDINSLISIGSGWTISNAHGINSSGQIAGTGKGPNGSVQAVLLAPVTLTVADNVGVSAPAGLVDNPIAFSGNGTGATLTLGGSGGGNGIAAGVSVTGSGTVNSIDDGGSANSLVLNGAITDSQSNTLVLQNGTFIPTASNSATFTGGTLQIGGGAAAPAVLQVANANDLPAGSAVLNLDGGTLQNTAGAALAVSNPIALGVAGGTINTGSQTVTLGGALNGAGGLTIAGGGTLALSDAATYTGQTTVASGTLELAATGGAINGTTGLTLASGAQVVMNNVHASNGITINYGSGTNPNSTIQSEIAAGAITAPAGYYVGYANGGDGVVTGLAAGQEKIMVTLGGDATLSGTVNLTDFAIFRNHFLQTGMQWDQGDFNHDGVVNLSDFAIFRLNFAQSLPAAPQFSARGVAITPEPATALLMVAMFLPLAFRRHHRVTS